MTVFDSFCASKLETIDKIIHIVARADVIHLGADADKSELFVDENAVVVVLVDVEFDRILSCRPRLFDEEIQLNSLDATVK